MHVHVYTRVHVHTNSMSRASEDGVSEPRIFLLLGFRLAALLERRGGGARNARDVHDVDDAVCVRVMVRMLYVLRG